MRAVPRQIRLLSLIAIALAAYVLSSAAQSKNSDGQSLITRAAEALGGRDRILKIRTLTIEGYGQLAYQNGGGNITSSIDAPQKWIDVNDFVRVVDLEHGRTRVRQRQVNDFVFAAAQNMKGIISHAGARRRRRVQHQRRRRRQHAHPLPQHGRAGWSRSRIRSCSCTWR